MKLSHGRSILCLTIAASALLPSAAMAFSMKCPWGTCPPKKQEVFDDVTKTLVWDVAHNPALMNLDYLQYFIGRPENESRETGANRHYVWYDKNRQPSYQLIQEESAPGQVTSSTLIVPLGGSGVTLDQLNALYGGNSRKFFDYNGHPNQIFSFAPDTAVSFASPPNTFRVSQAKITYRGAPLPQPSQEDLAQAESSMVDQSRNLGSQLFQNSSTPPSSEDLALLFDRVKAQPYNAEAHVYLAKALQQRGMIHQSIGEYKLALALSGNDPEVGQVALDALRSMNLLPPDTPQPPRTFQFVDNGQRIRVAGTEPQPGNGSNNQNNQNSGYNPNYSSNPGYPGNPNQMNPGSAPDPNGQPF